jgi:uncharacterized protein
MKKNKYVYFLLSIFTAAMIMVNSCAIQQEKNQIRSVSVSGTGTVYVKPDKAVIELAVITAGNDVKTATEENASKMTKVQEAVIAAGIQKNKITTQNYRIYQENDWNKEKHIAENYKVSNEVTIILSTIDNAGSIIDIAIRAGANQLSSLSFETTDSINATKQARILAVKQAEETARILASSTGANLGKVLTIAEDADNSNFRTMNFASKALDAEENFSTPVSIGAEKINVTVHITYALQ